MANAQEQCVFVAGHRGMVGAAICHRLKAEGYRNIITATRDELDLTDQSAVNDFFRANRVGHVYLAAARVGGILANDTYPADFITENLSIELNVIQAAHHTNVEKLLMLGSSCIYPKHAAQPMNEEALLTGTLEPTNEPYAIAKIAGIKLCDSYNRQYGRDYRCVMPTNLYGPRDNFHPENSHVIPALMQRFHAAVRDGKEEVTIWGSGKPRREFMHVDDLADACVFLMQMSREAFCEHAPPRCSHINIGTGRECSISELAQTLARVTGFQGRLIFDKSKPDGAPRKLLDVSRLRELGWTATISLDAGLKAAYEWYVKNERRHENTTTCH